MKKYLLSIILSMLMLLVTSKTAFAALAVAAPTEVKATVNSYNSVKISWTDTINSPSSPISYNVYRSTSAPGPFTLIANVSGKSYIDTGVKRWQTYYYAVRAKITISSINIYSSYAYAADSVTPILNVPASFKAVCNSYNSIKTNWAPVEKADCYLLYRASSETGSYEEILKTTNTSYIDSALTTGQKYFYKVCAYTDSTSPNWDLADPNIVIKSYTTPFSDASATPALNTPSLRYGNNNQDSVAIWNAIEGADGYDGYYIASNNNNYSYTVTFSLPASQGYYNIYSPRGILTFYIRAYRFVGTNKVYGSYAGAVWTVGMTGGPIR